MRVAVLLALALLAPLAAADPVEITPILMDESSDCPHYEQRSWSDANGGWSETTSHCTERIVLGGVRVGSEGQPLVEVDAVQDNPGDSTRTTHNAKDGRSWVNQTEAERTAYVLVVTTPAGETRLQLVSCGATPDWRDAYDGPERVTSRNDDGCTTGYDTDSGGLSATQNCEERQQIDTPSGSSYRHQTRGSGCTVAARAFAVGEEREAGAEYASCVDDRDDSAGNQVESASWCSTGATGLAALETTFDETRRPNHVDSVQSTEVVAAGSRVGQWCSDRYDRVYPVESSGQSCALTYTLDVGGSRTSGTIPYSPLRELGERQRWRKRLLGLCRDPRHGGVRGSRNPPRGERDVEHGDEDAPRPGLRHRAVGAVADDMRREAVLKDSEHPGRSLQALISAGDILLSWTAAWAPSPSSSPFFSCHSRLPTRSR